MPILFFFKHIFEFLETVTIQKNSAGVFIKHTFFAEIDRITGGEKRKQRAKG